MTCILCNEKSVIYRKAKFKNNWVSICPDCLAQFKITGIDKLRIELV